MTPTPFQAYPSTRLRVMRGLLGLGFLALLVLGIFAAVRYTDWFTRLGKGSQTIAQGTLPPWMLQKVKATAPDSNGVVPVKLIEECDQTCQELKRLRAELEALKKQKPAPTAPKPPPPALKRAPVHFVSLERPKDAKIGEVHYATAPWHYISTVLENVLVSEISGFFTLRMTRPVCDVSGRYVLIPQGQRIGAKAETAHLLFGNERIPAFSLTVAMPDGSDVDLGQAPILDAAGTNGLTGEVNSHWWRLVWTSIFIEGLRLGQQVVNQAMINSSDSITVTGVGQYSSSLAQQRLGRAQDTRPTITAFAGEKANVLLPKALSLPAVGSCQSYDHARR